jgi:ABC-type transporter Mla MlaB component
MRSGPPDRLNGVDGDGASVSLRIRGPLHRGDLPALSERCCAFFSAYAGHTVTCDVSGVQADAVTVDALARLQWVARHNGCRVVLRNATAELLELVELMGLTDVLPAS